MYILYIYNRESIFRIILILYSLCIYNNIYDYHNYTIYKRKLIKKDFQSANSKNFEILEIYMYV